MWLRDTRFSPSTDVLILRPRTLPWIPLTSRGSKQILSRPVASRCSSWCHKRDWFLFPGSMPVSRVRESHYHLPSFLTMHMALRPITAGESGMLKARCGITSWSITSLFQYRRALSHQLSPVVNLTMLMPATGNPVHRRTNKITIRGGGVG
jgi:hypothetical protein